MDTHALLVFLVVGLVAGFLASLIVGGGGLVRYLVTGVIGAFVGGFLFRRLEFTSASPISGLLRSFMPRLAQLSLFLSPGWLPERRFWRSFYA